MVIDRSDNDIIQLACLNCGKYLRKNRYFCSRRCMIEFTKKARKLGFTSRQFVKIKMID